MPQQNARYVPTTPPRLAEGWSMERLIPASRMYGANGLRNGPDGRIYIAEFVGSRISALDVQTGELETISPHGGEIVGPDDLAFDDHGNLYVTEFVNERVSVRQPNGCTRVLCSDVPGANGITFHQGRLFIDECRLGGRLLELDLNGGTPRVVLENLELPNALAPGPDGRLYFPLVRAGEIWRVHPDGGSAEKVIGGLGHVSAVKFDTEGYIVCTLPAAGQVVRIDPRNGNRKILAALAAPLDNLAFMGSRIFVSQMIDGRVSEILADGTSRDLLQGGLHGPLDLAVGADGRLYIADQIAMYALTPGSDLELIGRMFDPAYPGGVRGLAPLEEGGFAVTTIFGRVALYRPRAKHYDVLADGLDQPYGIAVAPGGAVVLAELGTGRVLSIESGEISVLGDSLRDPTDVVVLPDGVCLVSEAGSGRVVKLTGTGTEPVVDGLQRPQGIMVRQGVLYISDCGSRQLIAFDLDAGVRTTIAAELPIGPPPGVIPKPLRGIAPLVGPLGAFAGIAGDCKGTIYLSADAEGSVMALRHS